jgi:hypothetical protein
MKVFKLHSSEWLLLVKFICLLVVSLAVVGCLFSLFYLSVSLSSIELHQTVKLMPFSAILTFYIILFLGIVVYYKLLFDSLLSLNERFKLLMDNIKSRSDNEQELNYTHLYKDTGNYVRLGGYQPMPNNTLINPLPPKSL